MDKFEGHPFYRKHDIDSAISSLWDFYKKHFIVLFIISLILSLITQTISAKINMTELQSITDPEEMLLKLGEYILPMALISLVSLFFSTIIHYHIIYGPVEEQGNFFHGILKSMGYFIPYLIIMILLAFFGSFLLFLGLIALVIGIFFAALYLMTLFLFILPVLMAEGPNIGNAIVRTFRLLHRNFWANIGWTAVFIVILLVISVILSGIVLLPFTGSFMKSFMNPEEATSLIELTRNPLYIGLSAIISALTFPLMPIFACILYFNGRVREQLPGQADNLVRDEEPKVKVEDLYAKPYADDHPEKPGNDNQLNS